jgi:hypothetical protein
VLQKTSKDGDEHMPNDRGRPEVWLRVTNRGAYISRKLYPWLIGLATAVFGAKAIFGF